MRAKPLRMLLPLLLIHIVGCAPDEIADNDPRMAPFEGKWRFDSQATLAEMEARGVEAETVRKLRELYKKHTDLFQHPDITITGLEIVGDGLLSSEYRLFALHKHDEILCAKAWYHEDRHDPGDMNKCFIQLEIIDSKLKMTLKHHDGWPEMNDPDLSLPIDSDAETCRNSQEIKNSPKEWEVNIFVR